MKLPMSVLASAIGLALGLPLSPTHASMGGAWTPALWFLANEQGIWLDPSDFTRYMGDSGLGPELLVNGDFSSGLTGWTASTGATVVAGELRLLGVTAAGLGDGSSATRYNTVAAVPNGTTYVVEFSARHISGASNLSAGALYVPIKAITPSENGGVTKRYRFVTTKTQPTPAFAVVGTSGEWAVSNVTCRAVVSATMFQDSAGTTPVTAVEQPVGLVLDKRLGLVRGPELCLNPTFATDTVWVKSGTTISGGTGNFSAAAAGSNLQLAGILNSAKTFEVTWTISSISVGGLYLHQGSTNGPTRSTPGTYTEIVRGGVNFYIMSVGASTTASVDNVSIKEIPGNHATQATTAQKPVLSARKNGFRQTENFSHADWIKVNLTPAQVSGAEWTLTPTVTSGQHQFTNNAGAKTGPAALTIEVKPNGYTKVAWKESNTSGVHSAFNLSGAGSVIESTAAGALITLLPDGFYRITMAVSTTGNVGRTFVICAPGYAGGDPNSSTFSGDGTSGVFVRYPQVEGGMTATTYQRVTTDTDYDTVGFPHYLKFDGVDDNLVTGNINFTATDKMTVMVGMAHQNTATGVVLELTDSVLSNTSFGDFYLAYESGTTFRLDGSSSPGLPSVVRSFNQAPFVVAANFNLAGATIADRLAPRVNGAPIAATSAGAGGTFYNAPLYIGRRAGTSLPTAMHLHQLVVRGAATADLTPGETFFATKL